MSQPQAEEREAPLSEEEQKEINEIDSKIKELDSSMSRITNLQNLLMEGSMDEETRF
jgi:hypothetical protein